MSAAAQKIVPFKPTPEKDEKGRFAPGNSGGGRRKGSRNKIGEEFLTALCDDFAEHGIATIAKMRETDPTGYIQTIARLVPRELGLSDLDKPAAQLSDGELMTGIAQTIAEMASSDVLTDHERAQLIAALQGTQPEFAQLDSAQWERKHIQDSGAASAPERSFRSAPPIAAGSRGP